MPSQAEPDSTAMVAVPTGCPRGCAAHRPDELFTVASLVTVVRTLASVALAMAGIARGSDLLLLTALLTHWVGDSADGMVARLRDEETRTGAALDICADRLCVAVIYVGFVAGHPEYAAALGVYLVEFMLLDSVLSLAFLRYPISGPNYFARVDRLIWRLNWWPPAKSANSALPALAAVLLGSPGLALALAGALLVVKAGCLVRLAADLRRTDESFPAHPSNSGRPSNAMRVPVSGHLH